MKINKLSYLDFAAVISYYGDPDDAVLDKIHSISCVALFDDLLAIWILFWY